MNGMIIHMLIHRTIIEVFSLMVSKKGEKQCISESADSCLHWYNLPLCVLKHNFIESNIGFALSYCVRLRWSVVGRRPGITASSLLIATGVCKLAAVIAQGRSLSADCHILPAALFHSQIIKSHCCLNAAVQRIVDVFCLTLFVLKTNTTIRTECYGNLFVTSSIQEALLAERHSFGTPRAAPTIKVFGRFSSTVYFLN